MSEVTRICEMLGVITSIVFMMSINNFRLSFDNVRVLVDLFMLLITMCDDNILALLNIGNIYNNIIVNITFFMFLLLGFLVALLVLLVMAVRTIMVSMAKVMTTRVSSTIGDSCKSYEQEENKELHCYSGTEDFPPCVTEGAEVNSGVSSTIGDSCKSCGQEENKELHCYSG